MVLGSAGKSVVRATQRIGRVIRKYKNKQFSAVVDFADSCKFLKHHSKARYDVYKMEPGFKVGKYPI